MGQRFTGRMPALLALILVPVLGLGACSSPEKPVSAASESAAGESSVSVESAGASAESPLVGSWTLSIDTPRGVQHPVLTVMKSGASYSATYEGRQGLLAIDEVVSDGNKFSFPLSITVPIGTIDVSYEGVIDGDTMTGVVQNPRGQVPFSGKRT